jgi:hypothetical protein
MDKKQTKKISSSLIHRRICVVITTTAGWMIMLKALSDV